MVLSELESRADIRYAFTENYENSMTCEKFTLTTENKLEHRLSGLCAANLPESSAWRWSCLEIKRKKLRKFFDDDEKWTGSYRDTWHFPNFVHRFFATCARMSHDDLKRLW